MNKVFVSNPFSELTVTLLLTIIGPLNSDIVLLSGPPSTLTDLANIPSTGVTTLIDVSAGDEITCKGFVDNVSGSNTRFAGESGINRTYFLGYKVSA